MFKNTFQSGFLSILYSIGSKPLQIWDKEVVNGHIKRLTDEDIQSNVLEILGSNVSTTYITCPADPAATLGIKLPFLVMIVKNMKKYFSFEVQVLDDKNVRRRFRASNFQSTTRVKPYICTMPLRLDEGWNQIQFNLSDFTKRAYGTNYVETLRVQVHANCRIRRIYFSDRLYSEEELPPEFKLFLPIQKTWCVLDWASWMTTCLAIVKIWHSPSQSLPDDLSEEGDRERESLVLLTWLLLWIQLIHLVLYWLTSHIVIAIVNHQCVLPILYWVEDDARMFYKAMCNCWRFNLVFQFKILLWKILLLHQKNELPSLWVCPININD